MLVNKITTGFVIQTFDTHSKRYIEQVFMAGDQVDYEVASRHSQTYGKPVDPNVMHVDGKEPYLPFDMVQPKQSS